jgi:RimJ/RimL family protein N-acetyltransferase
MIIESNGITIERLREKDIELVRKWRNSRFVKQYMNYRETITPEMQKKWFASVNNFNNFYFIISYKNEKVGLGNIKNVDWEKMEGEAGIFITKQKLIGSILPVVGSLTLSDIVFKIFRLERIVAQIRQDNPRSKKLSLLMGSKLADDQDGKESQLYHLTRDNFYKSTKKFFMLMIPMGFSRGKMSIAFDDYDFNTGFADKFISLIEKSELEFSSEEKEGFVIYNELS